MTTQAGSKCCLSRLLLNPRSHQVVSEMERPYELHRTVMRAFPDAEHGGPGRVLLRTDEAADGGGPVLLVQSEKVPDWSHVQGLPGYLLATPETRTDYPPAFSHGQTLIFRLRANPTRRDKDTKKREGVLTEEKQREWLVRKGQTGGFEVLSVSVTDESFKRASRGRPGEEVKPMSHLAVRYDGVLRVTDPDVFRETIIAGIGSGKAFGFGLLSVAPFRG
jgi:CRISPR system Cascade subunit CasE